MIRISRLLVPLLLLITACGFHLRGSLPQTRFEGNAISSIFVRASGSGNVANEVAARLKQAGVAVLPESGQAEYRLALANERLERDVISVSAETGKVEEYRLILSVRMSVSHRDDGLLLEGDTVEAARDYTFDEEAVLGAFSEEQVLREEMTRRLAAQVVSRLNATVRNRRNGETSG